MNKTIEQWRLVDPKLCASQNSMAANEHLIRDAQKDISDLAKINTARDKRIAELEAALKFYADGDHFCTDDGLNWDSCSGEPSNILWHESEPWFIEDGSIAKNALSKGGRHD